MGLFNFRAYTINYTKSFAEQLTIIVMIRYCTKHLTKLMYIKKPTFSGNKELCLNIYKIH